MSIPLVIAGQVINFPSSAESPDWSPAIIQFAQAVTAALSSAVGPYDVPPQTQNIDASNPGTNVNITSLSFPISQVRSAFIYYAVYRTTSTTTAYEAGTLNIVYNPSNPIGMKWEIGQERVGDAQIVFNVTDTGQVQFSTALLGGINHTGRISFNAHSLLQT